MQEEVESQCSNLVKSSETLSKVIPLKITLVGDEIVGKSSILITNMTMKFPNEFVSCTGFDNFQKKIIVDGQEYKLGLVDVADPNDFGRLWPIYYLDTDCFLLCYSVGSRTSFENIASKWHPEIQHHCPGIPALLIGTKSDLRQSHNNKCVSPEEGKKMKKMIGAVKYLECSSLTNEGLDTLFTEAVRATIEKPIKNYFVFPFNQCWK